MLDRYQGDIIRIPNLAPLDRNRLWLTCRQRRRDVPYTWLNPSHGTAKDVFVHYLRVRRYCSFVCVGKKVTKINQEKKMLYKTK